VLANQRRAGRRRTALVERLARSEAPVVVPPSEDPRAAAVHAALATLAPRDRELLLLVERDAVSPEQAAQVLGTSRGATRVRLHRARRRFAAAYEAQRVPVHPTTEGAPNV
jgi:RNA polymerase sigma-70 factor (ECF subfamily)